MPPRYLDDDELQARETIILDQALELIAEQGIAFLTMDKLVSRVSYSKGTVYNHFTSKEDVFAALCNQNMHRIWELFSRAGNLQVSARKKMTAIVFSYMVSVLSAPQRFMLVMNAKTEILDKASATRQEQYKQLDNQLFGVVLNIIQEAVANDELNLKKDVDAQQIAFCVWAMCFGTIGLLVNSEKSCVATTGMMLESRVLAHANVVMDGFGWQRDNKDEEEYLRYLKTDIYAAEMQLIDELNGELGLQTQIG